MTFRHADSRRWNSPLVLVSAKESLAITFKALEWKLALSFFMGEKGLDISDRNGCVL